MARSAYRNLLAIVTDDVELADQGLAHAALVREPVFAVAEARVVLEAERDMISGPEPVVGGSRSPIF